MVDKFFALSLFKKKKKSCLHIGLICKVLSLFVFYLQMCNSIRDPWHKLPECWLRWASMQECLLDELVEQVHQMVTSHLRILLVLLSRVSLAPITDKYSYTPPCFRLVGHAREGSYIQDKCCTHLRFIVQRMKSLVSVWAKLIPKDSVISWSL